MARRLTVAQPLPPGDHADRLRDDPMTWLPWPRPSGLDVWRITLHVGGVERAVDCRVGDPWATQEGLSRRLVWTPLPSEGDVMPLERWLPEFDGCLHLVGTRATPSLVLVGDVEVPLGRIGDMVDALGLHHVADRGAAAFLRDVATRLAVEPSQPVGTGTHQRS